MRKLPHRISQLIALVVTAMLVATGCGLSPGSSDPTIGAHLATSSSSKTSRVASRLIVKFRPGASETALKSVSRYVAGTIPGLGLSVLSMDARNQVSTLASAGAIEYSEPDLPVGINLALNDPMVAKQWGHQAIQLSAAHDVSLGDPSIVVAVIDTGIDLNHPDLRNRLVPGVSIVAGSSGPDDDHGHGTHVAGIIAAEANNGLGVVGVAPRCRLMPIKALDAHGQGNTSDIVAGLVWAVDHGARVINMSLGGAGGGKALEAAIAYAQQRGVVVVAAMGNDGQNTANYPATYPGVIAVGALDQLGQRSEFSNFGRWISVVAPGSDVYSTMPTHHFTLLDEDPYTDLNYGTLSGTSMASPYVAGLAALILSVSPRLSPAAVKSQIERGADDVMSAGFDSFTGFGRINAARSLGAIR